jgi:hypothetical protein
MNFAPEGMEYNFKKFRNFLVEGSIKIRPIRFKFKLDNQNVSPLVDVGPVYTNFDIYMGTDPADIEQPPEGYRVGINGRARALGICMTDYNAPVLWVDNTGVLPGIDEEFDRSSDGYPWEIFDMRAYWTYSGRGPAKRS